MNEAITYNNLDDNPLNIKTEIEIEGFHTIYYFEHGKNFANPPEKHEPWELVYVDEGELIAISDGMGTKLSQGMVIFHHPNEAHAHHSDKKNAHNIIVITFTCNSPAMDFFSKKVFTLDKTSKALLSLFIKEAQASIGERPLIYTHKIGVDDASVPFGATQLLKCYLTEFLINLIRTESGAESKHIPSEQSRTIATNSLMEMISDYLSDNVYNDISLETLCEKFMLGKSVLSADFKAYTGDSPMKYFKTLKIKEAKKLLRNTDLSVSEISEKLRYSSIHIFSRAFKNETGFSPGEYKKSLQIK